MKKPRNDDLALLETASPPPRPWTIAVPTNEVKAAVDDARAQRARLVSAVLARAVRDGSDRTASLRLEKFARAIMAVNPSLEPISIWATDWSALSTNDVEMIDRAISRQWTGGPSTRNGIRDAVRSVVKASWAQGSIDAEQRDRLLDAIRPEKLTAAKDAQGHRHVPAATIASSFAALRLDPSPTARRDAALIATLVGCGLRRQEAVDIDLDQFDGDQLCRVVGRGGTLRDVPCPAGVRRAIVQWTTARGSEPGPLFTSMDRHRVPSLGRLATDTVRQIVERRVGTDVSPHMLRGTWVGDLLDAGSDLSVVSKMAGHKSPSTTARYDRRGSVARKAAADLLTVPFMAFELDAGGEG